MKVAAVIALVLAASIVHAAPEPQKRQPPIDILCDVPQGLKPGSEVIATVVFVPGIDVDRLDVDLGASRDLAIVEKPSKLSFANLKRGERVSVDVKVRLTGELGLLDVAARLVWPTTQEVRYLAFIFEAAKGPGGRAH